MTNPDDFSLLKSLVDDHESHRLAGDEYRAQRKIILDRLDQQYNSVPIDVVVEDDTGLLDRVGGFFKGLRQP